MINISVSNEDRQQLAYGDMKTLKKVLEAEEARTTKMLVENTDPSIFRFYQGAVQAYQAIIKLLP